ncbi:MAG: two-component sensor histidine kinase [Actinotalea sp.]|nr:two-component sensor histidine kinase [Actinotalea sp.]
MTPLAGVRSIKAKLGLVVVGATGAGLLGAVYGLQSGFRVRWTLLLSLAVALAVVQLLARGMTAPLREMAAAASAMAKGDHDVRVAVRSRDEVGQLAQAFNAMAADLAAVDAQRRRLVADVSHELRTPLTALQAQLENMADGVSGTETVGTALAQTARLSRLVRQLLDLSRLEAGEVPLHRERLDVQRLVDDALDEAAALGRDVHLEGRVDPPGLVVHADPERLAQVLANLLDNATRHSPAGGRVLLTASRRPVGVRLEVVDEGPGIGPDDRERVFSRFTRTDAARASSSGGSGLGLSIVRWVVDLHGGAVHVGAAPPGGGCRLVVDLPA